ncbi:MAG: DUF11 domain-containing protein [Pirellulaceae bacterium]|nr:DUF11 domain-containing protein [Pirellulaceae bacterium]
MLYRSLANNRQRLSNGGLIAGAVSLCCAMAGCGALSSSKRANVFETTSQLTQPESIQSAEGCTAVAKSKAAWDCKIVQASCQCPADSPFAEGQGCPTSVDRATHARGCIGNHHRGQIPGPPSGEGSYVCGPAPDEGYYGYTPIVDEQEYVFDGGDGQEPAVALEDWRAAGVEATDTVAYYQTEGGKVCLQPSNRVAVYAPRFGAVRQVTGAVLAENAQSTGRVYAPVVASGVDDRNPAIQVSASLGTIGRKQVQQLDRFEEQRASLPLESALPALPVSDAVAALMNVDVNVVDRAAQRERADVRQVRVPVETTYQPESLVVLVDDQPVPVLLGNKSPADVHVYENPDKCGIRLTKSASHTMAGPGDIIRFTIRYENISPGKLNKLVVLDSLMPRLEYIEASQHSSVRAGFKVEVNEAGSSLLRWEIESTVQPHEGGVISFDCRVR